MKYPKEDQLLRKKEKCRDRDRDRTEKQDEGPFESFLEETHMSHLSRHDIRTHAREQEKSDTHDSSEEEPKEWRRKPHTHIKNKDQEVSQVYPSHTDEEYSPDDIEERDAPDLSDG